MDKGRRRSKSFGTNILDLTGANLVAYIIRIVRDIVEKNPRFKNTLGTVTFPSNTHIKWNDTQVIIRNVTTAGTRLSFDYFLCTQQGRAILAKVRDKPGQLVEWVRETDKTRRTPAAGVYYLNVDYFNEQTNDIGLTCQYFRWEEGKIVNAAGSQVFFRPGIDVTLLSMSDLETGNPVQFAGFNQTNGAFANLLTPVSKLVCTWTNSLFAPVWNPDITYATGATVTYAATVWKAAISNVGQLPGPDTVWIPYAALSPDIPNPLAGQTLVPLADYWYERQQTVTICQKTLGGSELVSIPANLGFTITDQDGYVLRPNLDYTMYGSNFIQLAAWSPSGSVLYCNAVTKLNPMVTSGTNPENILRIGLQPDEILAPGQAFIHTTAGDFTGLTAESDGTIILSQLLQPGEYCHWEVRIETPQVKASAKKWELNSLIVVDPNTIQFKQPPAAQGEPQPASVQVSAGSPLLANGQQRYFLPGLVLAVGDQVIVGDQAAIVVSPTLTETYEVFGSKENISFTLEVKSNDLQTSSDLSEMLKQQLLILGRENCEADGLTVFEATRDFQGAARDPSATAPSYIYTVGVTASADWKVYVPLITRLVRYEITNTPSNPGFQGKLQMASRLKALGAAQFIPNYR